MYSFIEVLEKLGILHKLSKMVGCSVFLKALQAHSLLDEPKDDKHVSIFCPIDAVYEKFQLRSDLPTNEKKILTYHIAQRRRRCGKVYRTSGGKVLFNSVRAKSGKVILIRVLTKN